jgi:2-polyprenyl-3-methyl-5-hydroxy-6-metoxy-1,4-benzoquinol methylase
MKKRTVSQSEKIHQTYHKRTKGSVKIIKDNNFTYHILLKHINDSFKIKGSKILDIGCGAGSLSLYMASKGGLVTGIDISKKAISECTKSARALNLKSTNFFQSYFPDGFTLGEKYDYVVFTEVIEHLENDISAVKKIEQLLKPGGLLLLSTPSISAPLHRLGLTNSFDREVGHLRRYSLAQLKELLKMNGFISIKSTKSEGILRNFLFVNPHAGRLVRYINRFGSGLVTKIDDITLKLFGESNYIIVAKKIGKKKKKVG